MRAFFLIKSSEIQTYTQIVVYKKTELTFCVSNLKSNSQTRTQRNIVRAQTRNMETFVSKDIPEPKATGTYVVPTLGLSDGTFVFTYLGAFLSYITPQDLPVGMSVCGFPFKLNLFLYMYICS